MFGFAKISPEEAQAQAQAEPPAEMAAAAEAPQPIRLSSKYRHSIQPPSVLFDGGETNLSVLEGLLENEKQQNKAEAWNKLDQTCRVQKLHAFAEKYGRENSLPQKEIKNLKAFFTTSLTKGKLQRAKDVIYDRETREVKAIPALHFNMENSAFTLRNLDEKRPATLKSSVR